MREILEELSWNLNNLSKLCLSLAENQKILSENNKTQEDKITIEKVREILAKKSSSGKTEEIKKILKKFGANKLSQINPDDFLAVIKEAEKL